jgi:hypothetical protein
MFYISNDKRGIFIISYNFLSFNIAEIKKSFLKIVMTLKKFMEIFIMKNI